MNVTTPYIARIKNNDFLLALVMAIGWHLLLFIIGSVIQGLAKHQSFDLLGQINHWDAGWYQTVLRDHYQTDGASAAFYPLFPLLVGALHVLSFGLLSYLVSGFIVNLVASWMAIAALLKIARKLLKSPWQPLLVILLFLTYPAAFFMHVFYSEAVFCALGFWAYYWSLQRKWHLVGMSLAILTAARLPAILVVMLCGLEYLRACGWNFRRIWNISLLWFLLIPLGFMLYALYLVTVRQDALGMFHAYHQTADWTYHQFNPNIIGTFWHAVGSSFDMLAGQLALTPVNISNILLPTLTLGILLGTSLYLLFAVKKWGIPLAITQLCGFVMFTLNNNVISVHRYALPLVGMYLATTHALAQTGKWKLLIAISILTANAVVLCLLLAFFVTDRFAG